MPAPLVEDGVVAGAGRLGRTEFFEQLEVAVRSAVDDALRPRGLTAHDCPYLARYFEHFRGQSVEHLSRAVTLYASPERHDAQGWIDAITRRAQLAASRWAEGRSDPMVAELTPTGQRDLDTSWHRWSDASATRDLLGPGRPLESGVRSRAEGAFGVDLSHVRIHTDEVAGHIAHRTGSRAFAVAEHIGFGADQYRPGTLTGDAVLAHELAHVGQQAGGGVGTAGQRVAEEDADRTAVAAAVRHAGAGDVVAAPRRGAGLSLQSCSSPPSMTDSEVTEFLAKNTLRVVVTQETTRFVAGMKKSVAVAVNSDPSVKDPVQQPSDHVIVNGMDIPRVVDVRAEVPYSDSRGVRPLAMHPPTGTFTLSMMFPGRYDIAATVLIAPGRMVQVTRSIDVEKANFVGESDAIAAQHLASVQANTPDLERVEWALQRAEVRQRAAKAGLLSQAVIDAWTQLSLAVVARAQAIQGGRSGSGTGTLLSDALVAFEAALQPVPPDLAAPIAIMRARSYSGDGARLRSAAAALSSAFDAWVLGRLEAQKGGAELATGIKQGMAIEKAVQEIQRRDPNAVKIPAVFHAESAYVRHELFVSGPVNTGTIVPVPLNLWLFSTGNGGWLLRDVSNPEEVFEYPGTGSDRNAVLFGLLVRMSEDKERFPDGRLHVQLPNKGAKAFAVKGKMTVTDWIGVMALILAAAGIIIVTAGTAATGVVAFGGYLLTTSAVVGAGLAVADTIDAYERGRLTGKRLALNALQVISSVATAGTSTMFANTARQGLSMARLGLNTRYILLNRVAAGADSATLLIMTGDVVVSLDEMGRSGTKDDQAGLRAALAIGQLLVQGTMTVVSAKNAFHGDLSSHPPIEVHEAGDGSLVVKNVGSAASAVTPSSSSTKPAGTQRVVEDFIAPGGAHFAQEHQTLRTSYNAYLKRCKSQKRAPLEPLEWVKYQSQGAAKDYLEGALPGWRATMKAQYPGSHPHLIDRPSNSPAEGSLISGAKGRWRHRRVRIDEIRPEVDGVGDPYWTFPDLVDGEVLVLPSGTRVWKEGSGTNLAIVEEQPVTESVSSQRTRTAGEATVYSRSDMGPDHVAAGTERSHGAANPGTGFDSPFGVAHGPQGLNQVLENNGLERYVRDLRDSAPDGVTYLYTSRTYKSGQNLTQRVYSIDAIQGNTIHPMFEFKIVIEGKLPNIKARLVDDETSVFSGADPFASPPLKGGAKGNVTGVEVPRTLRDAMTRTSRRVLSDAQSPVAKTLDQITAMRGRLDDLLEIRLSPGGAPDLGWINAESKALRALENAHTRIDNAVSSTMDTEELRRMLTDLARRAGRDPERIDARLLNDFADRVNQLDLD